MALDVETVVVVDEDTVYSDVFIVEVNSGRTLVLPSGLVLAVPVEVSTLRLVDVYPVVIETGCWLRQPTRLNRRPIPSEDHFVGTSRQ